MPDSPIVLHVLAIGTGTTGIYGIGRTPERARMDLETQAPRAEEEAHAFTLTASDSAGVEAVVRALLAECSAAHVAAVLAEFGIAA